MAQRQGTFQRVVNASQTHARTEGKGKLRSYASDLREFFRMVADWKNGSYRGVSRTAVVLTVAALVYFVSPIDLIPDWIIGLGQIDDAVVLALCINMLRGEVANYRAWRNTIVVDGGAGSPA